MSLTRCMEKPLQFNVVDLGYTIEKVSMDGMFQTLENLQSVDLNKK